MVAFIAGVSPPAVRIPMRFMNVSIWHNRKLPASLH
jgi:hypothetical protein